MCSRKEREATYYMRFISHWQIISWDGRVDAITLVVPKYVQKRSIVHCVICDNWIMIKFSSLANKIINSGASTIPLCSSINNIPRRSNLRVMFNGSFKFEQSILSQRSRPYSYYDHRLKHMRKLCSPAVCHNVLHHNIRNFLLFSRYIAIDNWQI